MLKSEWDSNLTNIQDSKGTCSHTRNTNWECGFTHTKSHRSWHAWMWGKQRMKPRSLPHICVMSPQLFVWWKPHSQLIYISYKRKRWQRILWVDSQQKLSIKSSKHDIGSLCLLNIQVVIVKLAPKFYKVCKWGVNFKFAFRFDMNWIWHELSCSTHWKMIPWNHFSCFFAFALGSWIFGLNVFCKWWWT